MARIPTPTAILEQNGAFDHDPARGVARENEPIPPGPLGDPPERWLLASQSAESDDARILAQLQIDAWREIERNAAKNVLTVSDRICLEMTCSLIARHRAGERLKSSEINLVKSFLAEMGFTPASRTRINAPTTEKQQSEDTFSRIASTGRGLKQ